MQTAKTPDPASGVQPAFEVSIEVSVKGDVLIWEGEARDLVMSALENSGTKHGLVFVSRDSKSNRYEVSDRDRSGYYEVRPGGERGNFVRPTHKIRISFLLERNIKEEDGSVLAGEILRGNRALESVIANAMRKTETVLVRIRTNVFDATKAISVGAVPTIEAKGSNELITSGRFEVFHREWIHVWIFSIPTNVVDFSAEARKRASSEALGLSWMTIDAASEHVAVELKKLVAKWSKASQGDLPDIEVESIGLDRKTITLVGAISVLKVGEVLVIPVVPADREVGVGEEEHVYVKVQRVGKEVATAVMVDGAGQATQGLDRTYAIDKRRPIRRM